MRRPRRHGRCGGLAGTRSLYRWNGRRHQGRCHLGWRHRRGRRQGSIRRRRRWRCRDRHDGHRCSRRSSTGRVWRGLSLAALALPLGRWNDRHARWDRRQGRGEFEFRRQLTGRARRRRRRRKDHGQRRSRGRRLRRLLGTGRCDCHQDEADRRAAEEHRFHVGLAATGVAASGDTASRAIAGPPATTGHTE